jgi:hypothetical protein
MDYQNCRLKAKLAQPALAIFAAFAVTSRRPGHGNQRVNPAPKTLFADAVAPHMG